MTLKKLRFWYFPFLLIKSSTSSKNMHVCFLFWWDACNCKRSKEKKSSFCPEILNTSPTRFPLFSHPIFKTKFELALMSWLMRLLPSPCCLKCVSLTIKSDQTGGKPKAWKSCWLWWDDMKLIYITLKIFSPDVQPYLTAEWPILPLNYTEVTMLFFYVGAFLEAIQKINFFF